MLILSRRTSEEVVFTCKQSIPAGTHFSVWISGVKGNQVRLAIDAPLSISVDRPEIAERKFGGEQEDGT